MKIKNLVGKKFGMLKVISRSEDYISLDGRRRVMWLCKCKCGKFLNVRSENLKSKHTNSCGCYKIARIKETHFQDLTNKKFGNLIVLNLSHMNKSKQAVWNCQCICNNKVLVTAQHLKNGNTKSCGCLRESYVALTLKKYFIKKYDAISEYKILKNSETNKWLPFDIYLPYYKIFIEIHGEQHYKLCTWHKQIAKRRNTSPEEEFERQVNRDKIKRRFAKKNGTYIEINLIKEKSVFEIIKNIESKIK